MPLGTLLHRPQSRPLYCAFQFPLGYGVSEWREECMYEWGTKETFCLFVQFSWLGINHATFSRMFRLLWLCLSLLLLLLLLFSRLFSLSLTWLIFNFIYYFFGWSFFVSHEIYNTCIAIVQFPAFLFPFSPFFFGKWATINCIYF